MPPSKNDFAFAPAGVSTLARMKCRVLYNTAREVIIEAPVKVFATVGFMILIWFALYALFSLVFSYFQRNELQFVVAVPLLFNFFFVALLVLLAFSNAILTYGTLFTHEEANYLLSSPLRVDSTVALKFLESLFFSSWSLILLGLPLMMAIARAYDDRGPQFYPMFIAFFLAFVPIPGAIGLLTSWAIARYLPRSAGKLLIGAGVIAILIVIVWGMRSVRDIGLVSNEWLDGFFGRMALIQAAVLPSTWVTRGIEAAIDNRSEDALCYLLVTFANGLFLSWLAVSIVSRGFLPAFDRARGSSAQARKSVVQASGGLAGKLFFFLPTSARLIAAKDMRTFVRDPLQWSQLVILFGLMALYLLNAPRFEMDESSRLSAFVPFLNLGAISFILATFTSRFVFPMVSLEGHQLWFIGLLPISRTWILLAKYAFSMVVTGGVAFAVMVLASYMLRISTTASLVYLAVTFCVCHGLCGFAVGFGARLPMFQQRNPARIANGLGGTINLISSVMLICTMLTGMGFVTFRVGDTGITTRAPQIVFLVVGLVCIVGLVAGTAAIWMGARHLKRLEV